MQVEIEGPMLSKVFSLPRSVLREGNRVWVKTPEGTLDIREVEVVLRNKDRVFVRRGLVDGDQLITSQLPAAIPGLKIRTVLRDHPRPTSTPAPTPKKRRKSS